MAILTRETTATGVTNNNAPLTNAELDNNFVELVADIAGKAALTDLSVTTNAAGTASLSYSNATGTFTYTPPDLSGYQTSAALNEDIDDRVAALLQAGNGIALDYDDVNNELTITSEVMEITAYNGTGSTLSKGTVVYQTGVQGSDISVAAATNTSASTMPAVGIVIADISNAATGKIAVSGFVKQLDTSAFSVGDVLYVGTSGALTATKPTGESNLIQNFGRAIKINAASGEILISGAGRTNDVPNLADGNVFIGNASNVAEKRALAAGDIASGTFADARIAQSNVTQHQAALSITESQISDFGTYLTDIVNDTTPQLGGNLDTNGYAVNFKDNNKATFGDSSDLQIYHDGSNSFIQDSGTGDLIVRTSNNLYLQSYSGAENYLTAATNGAVTLYYDNAAKLATTSTGIDVTGNITVSGTVDGRDIATDGSKLDGVEASADVTDTTNVAAAGAVMDGDFTANGFMKRTGAGTYTVDTSTYLTTVALNDVSDVVITSLSSGQILKYNGTNWVNDTDAGGIALTDLSVTTNSAGTAALSYNNTNGVFSYTPPDLSGYLTSYTETDTLDSVTGRGATTTNDISVGDITADQSLTLANGAKVVISSGNSAFTDFLGGSTDNTSDDGLFAFYGGRAYNQGAGVVLYGDDHATLPNVISFRNTTFVERFAIQADGTASFKNGIEEAQYSLTGTAIDPANGTIQYKTLSANTTFTESLADGEFVTLMIDDGAGFTVTWPTTTWVGGSAPTLATSGYNVIHLWHINGVLYGAFIGTA